MAVDEQQNPRVTMESATVLAVRIEVAELYGVG
jgi:hypothetical protein